MTLIFLQFFEKLGHFYCLDRILKVTLRYLRTRLKIRIKILRKTIMNNIKNKIENIKNTIRIKLKDTCMMVDQWMHK